MREPVNISSIVSKLGFESCAFCLPVCRMISSTLGLLDGVAWSNQLSTYPTELYSICPVVGYDLPFPFMS